MRVDSRAVGLCVAVAFAGHAWAQQDAPSVLDAKPARLTFRADLMLWNMGPGGDVDLPSIGAPDAEKVDIDGLGYDTPRVVPNPELTVGFHPWRVTARGYHFSGDRRTLAGAVSAVGGVRFNPDSEIESNFSFGSYDIEVGYEFYTFPPAQRENVGRSAFGRVEVLGGVRAIDMDWDVARVSSGSPPPFPGPASVGVDEVFVHPYVGARMELSYLKDGREWLGLDVQIDVGGLPMQERASYSGDVIVGGWWRPWQNVAIQIGYRAAFFSLSVDGDSSGEDFTFDGSNQGLQAGVLLTF
jgi:hypothetical protein